MTGLFRHRQTIYQPETIGALLRRKMGKNIKQLQ